MAGIRRPRASSWRSIPTDPNPIPQKKADSRLAIAYLDERVAGNADPHRFGKGPKADLAGLRRYRFGDSAILYGLIQYRKPVDLREESSPAFPTVESLRSARWLEGNTK